jgi:hypothetical protein
MIRSKTKMPRTLLDNEELTALFLAIVSDRGRNDVEGLLERCHEYVSSADPTNKWLQPYEKYFRKEVSYGDFELLFRYFLCEEDTVVAADIQFKRPSRFPAPYWNRNRRLVAILRKLLQEKYRESGVEVKDQEGGRQIHFNVDSAVPSWSASTPFEDWKSECAIYDEPYSSGITDPSKTTIRNDFVIVRFRRKPIRSAT